MKLPFRLSVNSNIPPPEPEPRSKVLAGVSASVFSNSARVPPLALAVSRAASKRHASVPLVLFIALILAKVAYIIDY
jgi:hypothetical protein